MNQATQTPVTTEATVVATPAAPKAPSKKSLALAIFSAAMAARAAGQFSTNKAFRGAVLTDIVSQLGVTMASAATMYNAAKKEAETADATVALGRDPKKEKAPSTGKRGRPAGSKNKAKAVVETPVAETPTETSTLVLPVETAEAEPVAATQEPVAADAAA